MIESVDDSVGRILRKLDALGIAGNTVVVFMSDNGGLWPRSTSNAPLRAGKAYPYEGGIREPLLIKWPGTTQPGTTCSVPVSSIDFFPTLLEIAGAKPQASVDGRSLVPLLKQSRFASTRRPLLALSALLERQPRPTVRRCARRRLEADRVLRGHARGAV